MFGELEMLLQFGIAKISTFFCPQKNGQIEQRHFRWQLNGLSELSTMIDKDAKSIKIDIT